MIPRYIIGKVICSPSEDLVDEDDAVSPHTTEEAPLIPLRDHTEASLRLRDFIDVRFMTAVLNEITISAMLSAFETVCYAYASVATTSVSNFIPDSTAIHYGDIQVVLDKCRSRLLGNISSKFPQHSNEQVRS